MLEKQQSVVKKEKETKVTKAKGNRRRFSVRSWEQQNQINVSKGIPTIKLEEEENNIVSRYYS